MRHALAVVAVVLSLAVPSYADTPTSALRTEYEQVLVPIISINVVPGVNGSLWQTEFAARNNGAAATLAFQQADLSDVANTATSVAAGTSFGLRPARDYENPLNPGVFIYVRKAEAANVSYSLRLRELSRQGEDFVELPVVRERDFTTGPLELLAVPTGRAARVHLRIYGASAAAARGEVVVRAFDGATKLFERQLTLTQPRAGAFPFTAATFLPNPAYAEVANFAQLPEIANRGNVRIEVAPVSPELRYWAFITVTNNDTQRVSVITSQ